MENMIRVGVGVLIVQDGKIFVGAPGTQWRGYRWYL